MKIDYQSILKEAEQLEISPSRIIKERIGYLSEDNDYKYGWGCSRCKNRIRRPDNGKLNCEIIGMNSDVDSVVDEDGTCRCFR